MEERGLVASQLVTLIPVESDPQIGNKDSHIIRRLDNSGAFDCCSIKGANHAIEDSTPDNEERFSFYR